MPVLVAVLVAVDVDVAAEVLVTDEVDEPAEVTLALVDVPLPPPSPVPPFKQFGLVLAPLFGQQMSELPPSVSFEMQTRPAAVSQSSLPVSGSLGVADVFRSQR